MNGKYALDTNIVIALFARDAPVEDRMVHADQVLIPSIVLGELYFGALRSARANANLARINEFATHSAVLACDTGTAREYGRIKHLLREKGQPLPENDIWIAAIALQHDLTLASRDEHYSAIDGLTVEAW